MRKVRMPEMSFPIFLCTVCALTSCHATISPPSKPQVIKLYTGPLTRQYHTFGEAVREVGKEFNLQIEVIPTSGSKENVELMENSAVDSSVAHLGLVQSDVAHRAWHGELPFTKPHLRARLVAPLFTEKIQILARPHLYLFSPSQLRGKKLWLGKAGSGSELTAQNVLEASGFSRADVDALSGSTVEYEKAVEALQEGRLDAVFQTSVAPAGRITKLLAPPSEVRLIALEWRAMELLASDGSYIQTSLQRSEYPSLDRAVLTVGTQALLLATDGSSQAAVQTVAALLQSLPARIEGKMREIMEQREPGSSQMVPVTLTLIGRRPAQPLLDRMHPAALPEIPTWPIQQESLWQIIVFVGVLAAVLPRGLTLPWTWEHARTKSLLVGIAMVALWLAGAVWLKEREGSVDEGFATLSSSSVSLAMSIGAKLPVPVPYQTPEPTTPGGREAFRYFTWMNVLLFSLVLLPGIKKVMQARKEKGTPSP